MIPFEEILGATLHRMGLAEPALMLEITGEWTEVAGEPWASRARPLYVRSGTLVVEAMEPGAVALLRYGVDELRRRLATRFGPTVVAAVEVRPPERRPRGQHR